MAREHAILIVSIWDDPDFIALEAMQQTVFFSLIANRDLSWCGVAPYLPKLTAVHFKDIGAPGMRGAIAGVRRDAEAIYFIGPWPSGLGGRSSIFNAGCLIQTVNGIVARNGGHPHTKSGKVMQELVQLCPPGIIADPFAGSGSTLVAAKALGRLAIGVELEERYCEVIAKRLSQGVLDFGEVDAGRLNDDGTPIRWEQIGRLDQHAYRELVLPIVHAAAPHIAEQVRQ